MDNFAFVTAADRSFAWQALNLIGSLQHHSDIFSAIYVYDLGMTPFQRSRFENIPGVTVRTVEPFMEHWRACWNWKPWVLNNVSERFVVYLDAGTQILRNLEPLAKAIQANGYFTVSQYETFNGHHSLSDIIPADYYERFGLDPKLESKPVVAGGLIGFDRQSDFYKKVIQPALELTKQGWATGWSAREANRNRGIHYVPDSPIRDCPLFRQDQTLINLLMYKNFAKPEVLPLAWFDPDSPKADPKQLVWNPRRLSPLAYTSQIRYTRGRSVNNFVNGMLRSLVKLRSLYYIRKLRQWLRRLIKG